MSGTDGGSDVALVFRIGGMHCASCGLLVDDVVEEVPGVVSSITDVRAGRTVVTVAGGIDPRAVVDAVSEVGYTAVLVT